MIMALGAEGKSSQSAEPCPCLTCLVPVPQPKSSFIKVMMERGFIHSCTDIGELDKKMEAGQVTAYLGFDATASSLHVGSLPLPPSLPLTPSCCLFFPAPWRQVGCPLACGVASACSLRLRALLLLKRDHTLVASNACCMPRPCSHACAVA
jgi:hypothetical protein